MITSGEGEPVPEGDGTWSGMDPTRPNIARVYDYLLGGKDNFVADRELGDKIKVALPEIRMGVEEQRASLRRAVRFLVGEAGVRQLVDIGSGLPTAGNVHEVAREVAPNVRVAYVDNDPVVLAHARALLATDELTIAFDGDLREPMQLVDGLRKFIDFDQPIGLLLCGVLHYLRDDEDPFGTTNVLYDALPPDSHVFVHHLLDNGDPSVAPTQAALQDAQGRGQFRTLDEIRRFFDGLTLIEPGIVIPSHWRPDGIRRAVQAHPTLSLAVVGIGRKD